MVYLEQREKVDVRPEKRLVYLERMGFHGPVKSFVFKCIGKSIKKKKKTSEFGVLLHFCGDLSSQMMT